MGWAAAVGLFLTAIQMGQGFSAARREREAAEEEASLRRQEAERQASRITDIELPELLADIRGQAVKGGFASYVGSPYIAMQEAMEDAYADVSDIRKSAGSEAAFISRTGRARARMRETQAVTSGIQAGVGIYRQEQNYRRVTEGDG